MAVFLSVLDISDEVCLKIGVRNFKTSFIIVNFISFKLLEILVQWHLKRDDGLDM
jgi:hypothetical protein